MSTYQDEKIEIDGQIYTIPISVQRSIIESYKRGIKKLENYRIYDSENKPVSLHLSQKWIEEFIVLKYPEEILELK